MAWCSVKIKYRDNFTFALPYGYWETRERWQKCYQLLLVLGPELERSHEII